MKLISSNEDTNQGNIHQWNLENLLLKNLFPSLENLTQNSVLKATKKIVISFMVAFIWNDTTYSFVIVLSTITGLHIQSLLFKYKSHINNYYVHKVWVCTVEYLSLMQRGRFVKEHIEIRELRNHRSRHMTDHVITQSRTPPSTSCTSPSRHWTRSCWPSWWRWRSPPWWGAAPAPPWGSSWSAPRSDRWSGGGKTSWQHLCG